MGGEEGSVDGLELIVDDINLRGAVAIGNLSDPAYAFDLRVNMLNLDRLIGEPDTPDEPTTQEAALLPVAALQGLKALSLLNQTRIEDGCTGSSNYGTQ